MGPAGFEQLRVEAIPIANGAQKQLPPLELNVGLVADCRDAHLDHIRLLPSSDARGTVRGSVQPAVSGAEVVLRCGGYTGTPCAKTRTGVDGTFQFDGVAAGPVGVWIQAPGYYQLRVYDLSARDGIESWFHPLHLERCPKGNCKIPQKQYIRTCA